MICDGQDRVGRREMRGVAVSGIRGEEAVGAEGKVVVARDEVDGDVRWDLEDGMEEGIIPLVPVAGISLPIRRTLAASLGIAHCAPTPIQHVPEDNDGVHPSQTHDHVPALAHEELVLHLPKLVDPWARVRGVRQARVGHVRVRE